MPGTEDHKNDGLNTGSSLIMSNKHRTEEQRILAEMLQVFKNSDLLNGKVPVDKLILQHLTPALRNDLSRLDKVDPERTKRIKKAIDKEIKHNKSPKGKRGK